MIMVTSALPGRGQDLHRGQPGDEHRDGAPTARVLLVDGDVANPALLPLLGLRESLGLHGRSRRIRASSSPTSCCGPTSSGSPSCPPGSTHRRATEVLSSEAMAAPDRRDGVAVPGPDRPLGRAAAARRRRSRACRRATWGRSSSWWKRTGRRTEPLKSAPRARRGSARWSTTMLNKARRTDVVLLTTYGYYGKHPGPS